MSTSSKVAHLRESDVEIGAPCWMTRLVGEGRPMFRKVHGRVISVIHTEKKDKAVQVVDSRKAANARPYQRPTRDYR